MEIRVALAEAGTANAHALNAALERAAAAMETFYPASEEEFRRLSSQALEIAEQVKLLTVEFPALSGPYETFALEAEDFALAAQFRPSADAAGVRELSGFQ